jgi:hypothetical protein
VTEQRKLAIEETIIENQEVDLIKLFLIYLFAFSYIILLMI